MTILAAPSVSGIVINEHLKNTAEPLGEGQMGIIDGRYDDGFAVEGGVGSTPCFQA
jgi:hypothetical protein